MRRIAIINQKGGVGKTTTTVNLGAALALQGRRVIVVDMDAQANLSMALGVEAPSGSPTSYALLMGEKDFGACVQPTKFPNLSLVPSNIDLSGAEMELASAMGREYLLRDALTAWSDAHAKKHGKFPCDYVLFDCPPSLGLLSINALAAAGEVLITLQTEFLALQGMSKLFDVVQLLKRRLNPELVVTGIVPSLYDSRLKLAREVLGEIRTYFKAQVVPYPIRTSVKLAEAPSFGQTIFEYAPDSNGAVDYMRLAGEIIGREARDPALAGLAPFDAKARLPAEPTSPPKKRVPPPPRKKAVTLTPQPAPAPTTKKTRETAPIPTQEVASKPARATTKAAKQPAVPPPAAPTTPPNPPSPKTSSIRGPVASPCTVRVDDLPPDAFEILSTHHES